MLCDQSTSQRAAIAAKVVQLRRSRTQRNATSSKGRQGNEVYRVREHLTEAEIEKLLATLKQNRYGQLGWLIGLLIYRHGLRVSEACDLRWDDVDLTKRTIIIRRRSPSVPFVAEVPAPANEEVDGTRSPSPAVCRASNLRTAALLCARTVHQRPPAFKPPR